MLILDIALWAVAAWWGYALVNAALNLLLVPRLSEEPLSGEAPSLTVVLPARNEEARVGEAVAAHCAQDYPGLQVVAVDDGSTDRTPDILKELAGRFANLQVVKGSPPPPGWLGKPNAQRMGLEAARGDYVLFADADVIYAPGTLRRAMGEMVRRDLDMLLLLSRLEGRGMEPLVLSMLDAFAFYASPTYLVNCRHLKGFAFGAGSGNLVRRSALEAAGGLEAIRSEVVDDVAMGRRIKAMRGRFRVVLAFREIRVRMYASFHDSIEGFTKNFFAFFGFHPLRAWVLQGADVAVHSLPALVFPLALLFPALAPLRLPAASALLAALVLNAGACLWSGHPLWVAACYPIRPWIWSHILWRSMRRYQREGLVWRGRRYGKGGKGVKN